MEQDIAEFKLLLQALQEIIDKASRRIEEIKSLGREIYGIDMRDNEIKIVRERCRALLEKGEEEFLAWGRLVGEGMLLERGKSYLKGKKMELGVMLEMLKDILARDERD